MCNADEIEVARKYCKSILMDESTRKGIKSVQIIKIKRNSGNLHIEWNA